MLCLTLRIGTIQRLCLIFHRDFRLTSTDRTNFWNIFHSTSCQILRNLRNNHVRLVYLDLISNTKFKFFHDADIMDACTADCRSFKLYRLKNRHRLIRPVRDGLHSISSNFVLRISSAHLKAKESLGNFAVVPSDCP